eukprot:1731933-Alexandrium_andersonii.AAC.1
MDRDKSDRSALTQPLPPLPQRSPSPKSASTTTDAPLNDEILAQGSRPGVTASLPLAELDPAPDQMPTAEARAPRSRTSDKKRLRVCEKRPRADATETRRDLKRTSGAT